MKALAATKRAMEAASEEHRGVLVSYSGGKDSLATADLCCRYFEDVSAFFMYFVPGLECTEIMLEQGRKLFGFEIRQYPHWVLANALSTGAFRFHDSVMMSDGYAGVFEYTLADVYAVARDDVGLELIATGARYGDSMWRRRMLAKADRETMLFPVEKWSKFDVLAYLKVQNLPIPDSSNRPATGVDLSTPSLLWLHDRWPADFRKLCEWFPLAEAVVWRRKFHGVGPVFTQEKANQATPA